MPARERSELAHKPARAVGQLCAVATLAGLFGGMGRQGIPRLGRFAVRGRGLVRRVGAGLVGFDDPGAHGVERLAGLRAARGGVGDFVWHVHGAPLVEDGARCKRAVGFWFRPAYQVRKGVVISFGIGSALLVVREGQRPVGRFVVSGDALGIADTVDHGLP